MGSCCNNTEVQPENQYNQVRESQRPLDDRKSKKEMKYYGQLKELHSKQIARKQEHIKQKTTIENRLNGWRRRAQQQFKNTKAKKTDIDQLKAYFSDQVRDRADQPEMKNDDLIVLEIKRGQIILMQKIQQQISEYKSNLESSFRESAKQIKTLYQERIAKLEKTITDKDDQIAKLENQFTSITYELTSLKTQHSDLLLKQQSYRDQINKLKTSMATAEKVSQHQLSLKLNTIEQLRSEINLQKKQIQKLLNQQEVFSSSFSTMSKLQSPSFSVEISEYFRNSPQQILKFLDSIPGQITKDPKQQGNMTCMFVSKDGLSLQKFIKINRTFLKRTIKEHQKRFRFVLIHKPDNK